MAAIVLCATVTVARATASAGLANRTIKFGSTYIISGQTGTASGRADHVQGAVTLTGSWGGGRWHVIAHIRVEAHTGRYRITLRPAHRGVLRLRLRTPEAVYPVVLTVI